MHRTLNDYYDRDTAGMLRWMQLSVVGLMLLALMVPFFAIFAPAEWNGLLFVIAIADYCGFSSREYFHRIFKEHEGVTPVQYQKRCFNVAL